MKDLVAKETEDAASVGGGVGGETQNLVSSGVVRVNFLLQKDYEMDDKFFFFPFILLTTCLQIARTNCIPG